MRKIGIITVLLALWVVVEFGVFLSQTWAGHLVVSANDGKYPRVDGVYKVADPPEPDTLMVLDVSIFPPRVVAEIAVMHGTPGTPNGVALSPDEKLALVSNTNKVNPKDKTRVIPDDALQVVDLESAPPKVSRLSLGRAPAGVSINRKGDLALVAHPSDGTVSVLTIEEKTVKHLGNVKIGDEKSRLSDVAISPGGRWALVSKRGEGTAAILSIDGTKVEYAKRDVTTGSNPFTLEISSDGKFAVVANQGPGGGNIDSVTLVDMTAPLIRSVEHVTVGQAPEGISISPNGQWLAVAVRDGSNMPKKSPFFAENGKLLLFSLAGGKLTKVAEALTGKNTQGVTFTPDGKHIIVQNYVDRELAFYGVAGKALKDTGVRVKVKGYPAAIRIAPQ
jgi:DNA-binding beta-propeller fold protein YncE